MNRFTRLAVLALVAISLAGLSSEYAHGQSVQIVEGVELSTTQVIFVIVLGAVAGTIRAWQGYDKSPNDFDLLLFINGIRDNVLIAIPIAFGAALTMPDLNPVGYVMIFFSVVGASSFAHKAKQKSIPSNATDEEIETILKSRG